jgi:CO/xanthine dehydrogenase FAD-binding subunit
MRPLPVVRPKDLSEALRYLREGGKPLAGGTDLLVAVRKGTESPNLLVYVGELPELRVLREEREGLEVGAALTHAELLAHPATERFPHFAFRSSDHRFPGHSGHGNSGRKHCHRLAGRR